MTLSHPEFLFVPQQVRFSSHESRRYHGSLCLPPFLFWQRPPGPETCLGTVAILPAVSSEPLSSELSDFVQLSLLLHKLLVFFPKACTTAVSLNTRSWKSSDPGIMGSYQSLCRLDAESHRVSSTSFFSLFSFEPLVDM